MTITHRLMRNTIGLHLQYDVFALDCEICVELKSDQLGKSG